jgi:hypothetical protein
MLPLSDFFSLFSLFRHAPNPLVSKSRNPRSPVKLAQFDMPNTPGSLGILGKSCLLHLLIKLDPANWAFATHFTLLWRQTSGLP